MDILLIANYKIKYDSSCLNELEHKCELKISREKRYTIVICIKRKKLKSIKAINNLNTPEEYFENWVTFKKY